MLSVFRFFHSGTKFKVRLWPLEQGNEVYLKNMSIKTKQINNNKTKPTLNLTVPYKKGY